MKEYERMLDMMTASDEDRHLALLHMEMLEPTVENLAKVMCLIHESCDMAALENQGIISWLNKFGRFTVHIKEPWSWAYIIETIEKLGASYPLIGFVLHRVWECCGWEGEGKQAFHYRNVVKRIKSKYGDIKNFRP